jgi:biotin operon repressor
MEQLSQETGLSRTTLWRSLTALVDSGLVQTTRTKRNLGRLYKNRYRLIKVETSTADSSNSIDNLTKVTNTTKVLNTSYLIGAQGPEEEETMVNRWSEDDDIGGYGLLEEKPVAQKVSKRDPKTRHQRPQDEWTPNDVASEFSSRLYSAVRGIPGMINTRSLMLVIASNRKKYGITAETELRLLDKFFGDTRNLNTVKKFPKNTIGLFMNFVTNNILSVTNEPSVEQAHQVAEEIEYLVASDGKRFDKSMPGRVALAEYEQSLREAK